MNVGFDQRNVMVFVLGTMSGLLDEERMYCDTLCAHYVNRAALYSFPNPLLASIIISTESIDMYKLLMYYYTHILKY